MAKAVYDDQEQKEKTPGSYDPDRVPSAEELERITGMDGAEVLEREEKAAAGEGKKKHVKERDQDSDEEETQALNEKLNDAWGKARKADSGGGLYKGEGEDDGFMSKLRKRKKALGAIGAGAAILLVIGGALFSFLNVFKLDHIMSNVDVKTFSRLNAATDRRSDRWVRAYIEIRLAKLNGPGTDPDSEFFRSKRVDTDNPIRDWYHTLRLSGFERDLAKNGIVFANRDAGDGIHFSVLFVDGEQVAGLTAKDVRQGKLLEAINNPTGANLDLLHQIDINLSEPGGNKKARAIVNVIVDQQTERHEVFKKYAMRRAITNTEGIRPWRFFEKTRDKIDNKKIDIRNKLVKAVIPSTTKSGALIYCLLGINNCQHDGDVGNTEENGAHLQSEVNDPDTPNPTSAPDTTSRELAKKIMVKVGIFGAALKIGAALDMMATVDKNITSGSLTSLVAQARGTQAAALYQVWETSRDQIKTGQVTAPEVGAMMGILNSSSNSDATNKVLNSSGDPAITNSPESREYCSAKHQELLSKPENFDIAYKEHAYLCPDKQIGGKSNAATIEADYKATAGQVIGPVASAWRHAKSIPVVGQVIDFASFLSDFASSILSGVLRSALDAVGLGDNVDDIVSWATTHLIAFLGAGPILTGAEPGGVMMNWIVQGASYTAESTSRQLGGALSNLITEKQTDTMMADYYASQNQQMSSYDKYVSLSNPESIGSKWAFAASNISGGSLGNILAGASNGFFGVFSNFTAKAKAAGDDSRRAANFSGIDMYDLAQCDNVAPLDINKPSDTSNIGAVLGPQAAADLDTAGWDVAGDMTKWYEFLYKESTDGKINKTIYNCAIFDRSIRGGLGRVNGYTDDGGLEDNASGAQGSGPVDTPTSPTDPGTQVAGSVALILPGAPAANSYGVSDPEGQGGHHLAVDWFAPANTTVYAPATGTVVRVSPDPNPGQKATGQVFGGTVGIRDAQGRLWVMRHISPTIAQGAKVTAGDPIGKVKDWAGATHIHLELYKAGSSDREYSAALAMNPIQVFQQAGLLKGLECAQCQQ